MARPPRLVLPSVPQHVIQRGNNRAPCFLSDADRQLYLRCLAEASVRHECGIHAYVLMPNHVHLLVTPGAAGSLSGMMQDLGRRYVRLFNDIHRRSGTLWEGRYKSCLIDSERYYFTCHRYIELNPVRAALVDEPGTYRWSSHRYYAVGNADPLIREHPLYEHLARAAVQRRDAFLALFNEPIAEAELERIRTAVAQGTALASEAFLTQLGNAVGRALTPPKRGRPNKANATRTDGGRRTGNNS
jgi:putative transposase